MILLSKSRIEKEMSGLIEDSLKCLDVEKEEDADDEMSASDDWDENVEVGRAEKGSSAIAVTPKIRLKCDVISRLMHVWLAVRSGPVNAQHE